MKRSTIVIILSIVPLGLASTLAGILTPGWTSILGIGTDILGTLYLFQTLLSLASSFLIGRLSDRLPRGPMLAVSLLVYGLAVVVMAFARNLGSIALALFLMGPAASSVVIICSAWLVSNHPHNAATSLARLNFSYALAAVAGPWIVKALGPGNLRLAAIGFALVPVALALILFLGGLHESPRTIAPEASPRKSRGGFGLLAGSLSMWWLGLAIFAYSGIEGGLVAWLPLYVETDVAQPWLAAGLWTSWFYTFLMLGRLIFTLVAKGLNVQRFLLLASLGMLVPAGIWYLVARGDYLLIPVALFGFLCAGIYPAFQMVLASRMSERMGIAGTWMTIFGSSANMIWPIITGTAIKALGVGTLPVILAVQALLLSLTVILLLSRSRRIP